MNLQFEYMYLFQELTIFSDHYVVFFCAVWKIFCCFDYFISCYLSTPPELDMHLLCTVIIDQCGEGARWRKLKSNDLFHDQINSSHIRLVFYLFNQAIVAPVSQKEFILFSKLFLVRLIDQ